MGNLNNRLPDQFHEILKNFPITPKRVEPFKLIYRVEAEEGIFALKEIKYPEDEFCYIYAAMEHLAAHGFVRINRIIAGKNCYPFSEYRGRRYFIARWINGREADYNQKKDLKVSAETLAQLHKSSKGFVPPYWEGRIKWGSWPDNMAGKTEELLKFKRQVSLRRNKTFFDQIFLAHVDYYVEECRKALKMLVNSGYEKWDRKEKGKNCFCHHDFAHHNVLIDGSGWGHVIDFDYCLSDIRCHDVASLMLRVLKKSRWNYRLAVNALKYYDGIRPVSSVETRIIRAILRFPQDFWQVAFAKYIERNQPRERLERKIKSWVLNKEKREYSLHRLEKLI